MSEIFLSFASPDEQFAVALKDALGQVGCKTRIAEESIFLNRTLAVKPLAEASAVILVLAEQVTASGGAALAVAAAKARKKRLILLLRSAETDTIPEQFGKLECLRVAGLPPPDIADLIDRTLKGNIEASISERETDEDQALHDFLSDYERYVMEILRPTKERLDGLFRSLEKNVFWADRLGRLATPSPVWKSEVRVKRPESVVDKLLRQPDIFPHGLAPKSLRTLNDTVAGRIIVYFLSNIREIHDAIMNSELIEISRKNEPTAYLPVELVNKLGLNGVKPLSKLSGYASIHYIARFRPNPDLPEQRPWFEIQVRTLAEHVWCEIEGLLGYKPDRELSLFFRSQFPVIGLHLMAIDQHFDLLLKDIMRQQREVVYTKESTLGSENLPAVLGELNISCAQKEIDLLLRILSDRGIKTVGSLKQAARMAPPEMIRQTYQDYRKEPPNNSEIVASIAATRGLRYHAHRVNAIKAQIDYQARWHRLRESNDR